MTDDSTHALRMPAALMRDLQIAAQRDGVSVNAFILQAVAQKLAALRTRGVPEVPAAPDEVGAGWDDPARL